MTVNKLDMTLHIVSLLMVIFSDSGILLKYLSLQDKSPYSTQKKNVSLVGGTVAVQDLEI